MENKKGQLCRSCQYGTAESRWTTEGRCQYILAEGHSRGCPARKCDKYIKGPKKKLKTFQDSMKCFGNPNKDAEEKQSQEVVIKKRKRRSIYTAEEAAERRRRRDREKYAKNRDKILAYQKKYREEHREELKEKARVRRASERTDNSQ